MARIKRGGITYDGQRLVFAPGVFPELKRIFWNKDVEAEVTKMNQYLAFKSDYKDFTRFVRGWLLRCQEKRYFQDRETETRYDPKEQVSSKAMNLISDLTSKFKVH